jgi:hypothetical protein
MQNFTGISKTRGVAQWKSVQSVSLEGLEVKTPPSTFCLFLVLSTLEYHHFYEPLDLESSDPETEYHIFN